MITLDQYFGVHRNHPDITDDIRDNAARLLDACEELEHMARDEGVEFPDNPVTRSGVSGQTYGGYRPRDCPQGALHSSHKEGLAVDRYDPQGKIDAWCMMNSGKGGLLEQCGVYIEHPDATKGWSHWTIKATKSGRRVFMP